MSYYKCYNILVKIVKSFETAFGIGGEEICTLFMQKEFYLLKMG